MILAKSLYIKFSVYLVQYLNICWTVIQINRGRFPWRILKIKLSTWTLKFDGSPASVIFIKDKRSKTNRGTKSGILASYLQKLKLSKLCSPFWKKQGVLCKMSKLQHIFPPNKKVATDKGNHFLLDTLSCVLFGFFVFRYKHYVI